MWCLETIQQINAKAHQLALAGEPERDAMERCDIRVLGNTSKQKLVTFTIQCDAQGRDKLIKKPSHADLEDAVADIKRRCPEATVILNNSTRTMIGREAR